MSVIDVNAQLHDVFDVPMYAPAETADDSPKPILLGDALVKVLINKLNGEKDVTGDESFTRFQLAQRIVGAMRGDGFVNLTAEDVVKLKKLSGLAYQSAGVLGPIWDLLDPAD